MNIAYLLRPKAEVAHIYDDSTVRQGMEKIRKLGYNAVPVIRKDGRYVTTVSQADFLAYILKCSDDHQGQISLKDFEDVLIKDMISIDKNPPAMITAQPEDLVFRAMEQNFIPVVDDSGSFIGIITRGDILKYLATSTSREI